jgi:mono/diheme cytochrome c family protein
LGEGASAVTLNPVKTIYTDGLSLEDYIMMYMPPGADPQLTDEESADLAAYVKTLPSAARGKALFETPAFGCVDCHGADGKGDTPLSKLVISKKSRSRNGGTLSTYISANMPLGDVGVCNKACADDIAKYIWTTFP